MNESAKKIIALDLPEMNPLPEHIAKYFKLCEDKLGMVPNVLKAYAFNETKLNAFTSMYNDLMLILINLDISFTKLLIVASSTLVKRPTDERKNPFFSITLFAVRLYVKNYL